MLDILQITTPFFALIAAGYVSVHRGWIDVESVRPLNSFVLFVALPCMLFKFSSGLSISTLWSDPFLLIYGGAGVLLLMVLMGIERWRGTSWREGAFVSLVGAFPNNGFIGVPLLALMMGTASATPVVAMVMFDMVITSSLAVAASRLDGQGWSQAAQALSKAVRGVFSNPMLWAILAGAALAWSDQRLPLVVQTPLWMMADAATPVALFTLGGILARSRIQGHAPLHGQQTAHLVVAKLLIHPALVWVGMATLSAMGVHVSPTSALAMLLVASLPSASNVTFLAERMGGDATWVARIIMWTTVWSFFTFTAGSWWFQLQKLTGSTSIA